MAKDSLSALLDGECSPRELDRILDEMERSPELKLAWSRLCLSRDAGEGVRVRKDQPCICAGVMSGLDARPQTVGSKVVPLFRQRIRGYWKPLAGFAAAASVAGVALTLNLGDRSSTVAAGAGMNLPQVSAPVSVPVVQRRPRYLQAVSASADDVQRAAMEDELRSYLIEHSNTLADRGMGATLSYARFAAHSVGEPISETESTDLAGEQP